MEQQQDHTPPSGDATPDGLYVELARQFVRQNWGMGHKGPAAQAGEFVRGESATLGYLSQTDAETTPGDLAREFGVSTARIASLLNGLERKGYVIREHSGEDRRKVIVIITDAGREVLRRKHDAGLNRLALLLEELGEHDARELVRISERVRTICKDDDMPCPPRFSERDE